MIEKGQKLIRNNKDFVSQDDISANRWFVSIMIILVAICTVGIVSMATGWPTNVSTGGAAESAEVVSDETDAESEADGENVVAETGDEGSATEDGAVVEATDGADVSVEESGDSGDTSAESAEDTATEDSGETGGETSGEQSGENGSETEQTEQQ